MCRGAMLGSRARHAAAADATTVRLPSSEGLFFASRARHAAAAKAATDPFELYRGLGQRLGRAIAQKALRSAPVFFVRGVSQPDLIECSLGRLCAS